MLKFTLTILDCSTFTIYFMDFAKRRDTRAKSKRLLQIEVEKDLRISEFFSASLLVETGEASSNCAHHKTPTTARLRDERIEQMETNLNLDPRACVNIIQDVFPVAQCTVLEDISKEDECSTEQEKKEEKEEQDDEDEEEDDDAEEDDEEVEEEEDNEELMLAKNESWLNNFYTLRYRFCIRISIGSHFLGTSMMLRISMNLVLRLFALKKKT